MFSAKLNAFESIIYISLHYLAVPIRCDDRVNVKVLRSKPLFVRNIQMYSCRVKPPHSQQFFGKAPDKKKHLDFFM